MVAVGVAVVVGVGVGVAVVVVVGVAVAVVFAVTCCAKHCTNTIVQIQNTKDFTLAWCKQHRA